MERKLNDQPLLSNMSLDTSINNKTISGADELGVYNYAWALVQFIESCPTPMTIGIQGDWGIGKTSLLNMMRGYLQTSSNKFGTIWFNTWHYSLFNQDEYLGISVIKALLDSLKKEFKINKTDPWYQKTSSKLFKVLKSAKFSAFGVNLDVEGVLNEQEEDSFGMDISALMLSFKADFQNLVDQIIKGSKEKGTPIHRLVFFVDDLDRVKPGKALELLESIKNFLDVDNCVFVIAVDYEVVQLGMQEKLGKDLQKTSGKSFFDKIIQLPFAMPTSCYELGPYIQNLLNSAGNKVKEIEVPFYEEITTCTIGRNPRSIKRVVNYVRLYRIIRDVYKDRSTKDSEQQRKLLFTMICMQIAWPEIFSYFVKSPTARVIKEIENWEFLDTIPQIQKLYDRTWDVEQLKTNISTFFDLIFNLLDVNNDGSISKEELQPIWDVLRIAKLTNVTEFQEPLESFLELAAQNGPSASLQKVREAYAASKWGTMGRLTYKVSGKRFAMIVHNRKQVGSLVSLKSYPFLLRIETKIPVEDVQKVVSEYIKDKETIDGIVFPLENSSLTGFGKLGFSFYYLKNLESRQITKICDDLFALAIEGVIENEKV